MSFHWLSLISGKIVAHSLDFDFPIEEIRDVVAYVAILYVMLKRSN